MLLALLAGPAAAEQVTDLVALYDHGQTFLTWTRPAGTGWTFNVYRATTPPLPGAGVSQYSLVGMARDSSGFNTRFYSLHDTLHTYTLPNGDTLAWTKSLFVHTPVTSSSAYYAITCESLSSPEDTTLVPGVNALAVPVVEWPDKIRPVYQRQATVIYGQFHVTADVYTLWTSDEDNGFVPAMCNRPSVPYDCAVSVNPGTSPIRALMFHAHSRAGNYFNFNFGTLAPGEHVITIDDFLPTDQRNTYWFGYVDGYDLTGSNPVPTQGPVMDYTLRRTVYTLDWARHAYPVDTARVYVMGGSMGGIGCVRLAVNHPELIAGVMALVPVFDMGYVNDPNPGNAFDLNGPERLNCNYLFGTVASQLPMPDAVPAFDRMDAKVGVAEHAGDFVSPMIAFSGRYDTITGWGEKPGFYTATQTFRAGGCYFFDTRLHHTSGTAQWTPQQDFLYLYRFRSDLSFPAFSNCSMDSDPGNGLSASGDSVGTINGYMDWEPELTDTPTLWSVRIQLRDLNGLFASFPAPETLRVDVTPRRVQEFVLAPLEPVEYTVVRSSDLSVVEQGVAIAGLDGIVTIPSVLVYRTGTQLTLERLVPASVGSAPPPVLRLAGLPNPVRGRCDFTVAWPRAGRGRVELFDPSGRRVRTLFEGPVQPASARIGLDLRDVGPGLYFLRATDGVRSLVRRLAVLAR